MRRSLLAIATAIAVGAAAFVHADRPTAPVSAGVAPPGALVMPDHAAITSLRSLAAIAAGQVRSLRAEVRQCPARETGGRCAVLALGHAAAGAKLSTIVVRAIAGRLPAGPCMRIAIQMGGLFSTLAYISVDGIRDAASPGYTRGAEIAAARIGNRIIAVHGGAWPRHCMSLRGELRA